MSPPLEAIKSLAQRRPSYLPARPFIILTPAEASDPALVAMLRRSGCELRVMEKVGGPSVPIEEGLKK